MPENKKHLLLVEDEAPLREALAERLAGAGLFDLEPVFGEALGQRLTQGSFVFDEEKMFFIFRHLEASEF